MSTEQNKQVVREYAAAFSRGDFEAVKRLCTPDVQIAGVLGKGGWDVVLPIWQMLHEAFDVQLEIDELAAEGDMVAARYTERGTFRGQFREHQPNGKKYAITAMEWFHFREGRIAERWGARDSATIMKQLGIN